MGRIDATSLAYKGSILATNSAAACENSNRCYSITNWRLPLVRGQDSAGLPAACKALAGAGGVGRCFGYLNLARPFCNKDTQITCHCGLPVSARSHEPQDVTESIHLHNLTILWRILISWQAVLRSAYPQSPTEELA